MTCVCSLAGTSACASCSNNPNSAKQYSNFVTWTNNVERTCENESDSGFLCSACRFGDFDGFHGYKPNYCPNCGAKVVHKTEKVWCDYDKETPVYTNGKAPNRGAKVVEE